MTRAAGRTFGLWLLAMLAGAAIVWNTRFTADMSFFLPARPSAEQQVLVDQIKEGVVARLLMVAIDGGDEEQRAALSRDLRGRLAKMPEFVSVQNGEAGSLDAGRDFLFAHRYLLSPAVTPERFTVAGLRTAIADSIDLLASPAGLMFKTLLPRDPTGELFALVGGLDAGAQPASRAGVWASRDGERALLLVQTTALGSDTDGQETAIRLVREQFAAATATGATGFTLTLSGPGLFAVKARATIKDEVTRLSAISTLAIVAVLFFVYRSPRLLTLGLLPVASGALAGIVAVSLAYGTVFGITVGFGSALIGEAIDYSIYYFVQSGRLGAAAWRERFWPTIRLGVLTSVCGFGALLFSGFPGLAQLGLYSLTGVATAALVTRFVLPPLAGDDLRVRDVGALGRALGRAIDGLRRLRWPVLALAVAALAWLGIEHDRLWTANLSALSTASAEDSAVDMALRADICARPIPAPWWSSAPATARRHCRAPSGQVLSSTNWSPPASSAATTPRPASCPAGRRRPRAAPACPPPTNCAPAWRRRWTACRWPPASSTASSPMSPQPAPWPTSITATSTAAAWRWSSIRCCCNMGTSGACCCRCARRPARRASPSRSRRCAPRWPVRTRCSSTSRREFDGLYADYLQEAVLLSLAGLLAIVVLLAATLRSPRRLAAVLLPLLVAVAFVVAGLHLLGERLHLLHLIGMLLIVAVGSNYALFFDRLAAGRDPATLASLAVANLTTAIGFGTLALSQVPVLHAIGVTVGPGAILALLLSAIFVGRAGTP